MFSKMMAGLRAEAEKVSGANCAMLANLKGKAVYGIEDKISGQSLKNKTFISGMGAGMGGIIGLIGVGMANQAAGMAAAGVSGMVGTSALAGASTALAGLGTIAVGSAVLPVATVVTLGAAAAGLVVMGISGLMNVNHQKGSDFLNAALANDRSTLSKFGAQDVGISDWLKGAKNLVVKSFRESFNGVSAGLDGRSASVNDLPGQALGQDDTYLNKDNVIFDYELADLFSDSFEDSVTSKQKIVDGIAGAAWDELGVVITDDKIHDCLAGTRRDMACSGKILNVNLKTGLVTQSLGRGQAIVHNLKDFQQVPVVGQDANIVYRGGKVQETLRQDNSKAVGNSVGR